LDEEQIGALRKGFEGFDKEQCGVISGTAIQMIFKMIGISVPVSTVLVSVALVYRKFFLYKPGHVSQMSVELFNKEIIFVDLSWLE